MFLLKSLPHSVHSIASCIGQTLLDPTQARMKTSPELLQEGWQDPVVGCQCLESGTSPPFLGESRLLPLSSRLGGCSGRRACTVVAVDPAGTLWFWGWQGVSKFTARSCSLACAWEPAKVLDLPCSGLSPCLTRNILGCELELQSCPEIFSKVCLWLLWSQGCAGPVFNSDSPHRSWPAHSPCWVWTSLLSWF